METLSWFIARWAITCSTCTLSKGTINYDTAQADHRGGYNNDFQAEDLNITRWWRFAEWARRRQDLLVAVALFPDLFSSEPQGSRWSRYFGDLCMDRANITSPLQGPAFVAANCNKAEGYFLSPGKGALRIPGLRKPKKERRCGHPMLRALCPWLHSSSWMWTIIWSSCITPRGCSPGWWEQVERDISSSVFPGGCKDQRTCWRSSGRVWCCTRSSEFQVFFYHCLFLLVAHA